MNAFLKRRLAFLIITVGVVAFGVSLNLNLRRDIAAPSDRFVSKARPVAERDAQAPRLDPVKAAPVAAEVRQQVKEVYAGPDFAEKDHELRFIPRKKAEAPPPAPGGLADWLARLFSPTLADVIRWVMWTLFALLLVWALFFGVRQWLTWRRTRDSAPGLAEMAVRRALRLDELPIDLVGAAQALWQQGSTVAALSLLYRGALKHLLDERGLKLATSFTEAECLRAARAQLDSATAADFAAVTQAWSDAAYAAKTPDNFAPLIACFRLRFMRAAPT